MAGQKRYIIDHFSISIEYLKTASGIGIEEAAIIKEYLKSIELTLNLKPDTLRVFYDEGMKDERTYWYTEATNTVYVNEFQGKMFVPKVNPILN